MMGASVFARGRKGRGLGKKSTGAVQAPVRMKQRGA